MLGDCAKAKEKLGWRLEVGFEQLIHMMVDTDLERVKRQAAVEASVVV